MKILLVTSRFHVQARQLHETMAELGIRAGDTVRVVTMRACRQFIAATEHIAIDPKFRFRGDAAVVKAVKPAVPTPPAADSQPRPAAPNQAPPKPPTATRTPRSLPRRLAAIARRARTAEGRRAIFERVKGHPRVKSLSTEPMKVICNTARSHSVRRWFADSDLVVPLDPDATKAVWLLLRTSQRPTVIATSSVGRETLQALRQGS